MKKKYIFIIATFALLFSTPSWALINWGEDELNKQLKGAFNKTDGSGVAIGGLNSSGDLKTATDVKFRTSLLANGRVGASTQVASSSTNLAPANLPYCILLKNIGAGSGGADAISQGTELPNGTKGQMLDIIISSCGNNGAASQWLLTPKTATGWSRLTFNAKGQTAMLLYVDDTIGWIIESVGTTAASASPTVTVVQFIGN